MTLVSSLALLNACLNATAGVLLALGYNAIRQRRIEKHQRLMRAAFIVSCVFLVSYLTRYSLSGDTPYRGQGWLRPLYFSILISHVFLAICTVPLVLRTLYLARKERFQEHRRIARITFPVWTYVSATGVIVYLMLYQLS